MKHKRYSEGKVEIVRSWPLQILGLALMIFVLIIGKRTDSFNTLRLFSLGLTYVLGLGLAIHPRLSKKHMERSILIAGIALVAAFAIALIVLSIHGSLFSKTPVAKPTAS